MEIHLGVFECIARSREYLRSRDKSATAVGGPNRILVNACGFPRHLIASRRLLGANRRPRTKRPGDSVSAAIVFQRGARARTDAVKEELAPHFIKTG